MYHLGHRSKYNSSYISYLRTLITEALKRTNGMDSLSHSFSNYSLVAGRYELSLAIRTAELRL